MKEMSAQLKLTAAACALAMLVFAINAPSIGTAHDTATAPVTPIATIEVPALPALPAILPR